MLRHLFKYLTLCSTVTLSSSVDLGGQYDEGSLNASCFIQMRFNGTKDPLPEGDGRLTEFENQYIRNNLGTQIYGDREPHRLVELITISSKAVDANIQYQSLKNRLQRANGSERLLHHHIWKNGGTHLCEMARSSGFTAPLNNGCHRFRDDGMPVSTNAYENASLWRPCAADSGLSQIPFNFVGHECPIDADIMTMAEKEGFVWIEVLRDPIQQAASWYMHMDYNLNLDGKKLNQNLSYGSIRNWTEHCNKNHSCGFYTFIPNIQTRWLAGGSCLESEHKTECLDKAMSNLRRMAVVLEQRGSELVGTEKLAKFGWTSPPDVSANRSSTYVSASDKYVASMSAEELAWLTDLQSIDLELIKRARAEGLL